MLTMPAVTITLQTLLQMVSRRNKLNRWQKKKWFRMPCDWFDSSRRTKALSFTTITRRISSKSSSTKSRSLARWSHHNSRISTMKKAALSLWLDSSWLSLDRCWDKMHWSSSGWSSNRRSSLCNTFSSVSLFLLQGL